MTATVKIGDAKAHFSELIAKVEAGEEFIISRGHLPAARLVPLDFERRLQVRKAIEAIKEFRQRVTVPTTQEEIRAWRDEGRRY